MSARNKLVGSNVVHEDSLRTMRERGGRWAAYQNVDLGHNRLGHLRYLNYGPLNTFKEPPERYPDTAEGVGWRYVWAGYVDLKEGIIVEEPPTEGRTT
jgi:hypothetical protein